MLRGVIGIGDGEEGLGVTSSTQSVKRANEPSAGEALTREGWRGHGEGDEDVAVIVRDKRGGGGDVIDDDDFRS